MTRNFFGVFSGGDYKTRREDIRQVYASSRRYTIDLIALPPYDVLALLWVACGWPHLHIAMALLRVPKLARLRLLPEVVQARRTGRAAQHCRDTERVLGGMCRALCLI